MRINHNIAALNTYNKLSANQTTTAKSLEKLSSGLKINRAGDNAAGLAISEKMRGQIRGLDQAVNNASDGISLIKTAEGGLNETHSILQRMRELAVQSANDTNTEADRTEIQKEVTELSSEITRISGTTQFNTKMLLDGTLGVKVTGDVATGGTAALLMVTDGIKVATKGVATGSTITLGVVEANNTVSATLNGVTQTITVGVPLGGDVNTMLAGATLNFDKIGLTLNLGGITDFSAAKYNSTTLKTSGESATFQIGANKNENVDLKIASMSATDLGVAAINVKTQADASIAIETIDSAISKVSSERSNLGSIQNRLEHTINNLGTSSENLTSAESRIRDVDMAKEMMEFTKNNILAQAATAMLAQANAQPQSVLQLLQ